MDSIKEEGVGTWDLHRGEAQSEPIYDTMTGGDRVIRHFAVYKKPGVIGSPEEVLKDCLPIIKRNVIKDGWTFEREPTIREAKDGWIIVTVLRPAMKHGSIVGVTNASPRSASELLREGNTNLAKLEKEKKRLAR